MAKARQRKQPRFFTVIEEDPQKARERIQAEIAEWAALGRTKRPNPALLKRVRRLVSEYGIGKIGRTFGNDPVLGSLVAELYGKSVKAGETPQHQNTATQDQIERLRQMLMHWNRKGWLN